MTTYLFTPARVRQVMQEMKCEYPEWGEAQNLPHLPRHAVWCLLVEQLGGDPPTAAQVDEALAYASQK